VFNRFWRADPARPGSVAAPAWGCPSRWRMRTCTAGGWRPGVSRGPAPVRLTLPRAAGAVLRESRSRWSRWTAAVRASHRYPARITPRSRTRRWPAMGDRRSAPRGGGWRACPVLLTGCARSVLGQPLGHGNAQVVNQSAGRDPVVRVFAEGPHDGDSVYSIVSGSWRLPAPSRTTSAPRASTHRFGLRAVASGRGRDRLRPHRGAHLREVHQPLEFHRTGRGHGGRPGCVSGRPTRQAGGGRLRSGQGRRQLAHRRRAAGLFISKQDFDREYSGQDCTSWPAASTPRCWSRTRSTCVGCRACRPRWSPPCWTQSRSVGER